MDSIDCMLLTKVITKEQSKAIINAFKENIDPEVLKERINKSNLSKSKKETYLGFFTTNKLKNV